MPLAIVVGDIGRSFSFFRMKPSTRPLSSPGRRRLTWLLRPKLLFSLASRDFVTPGTLAPPPGRFFLVDFRLAFGDLTVIADPLYGRHTPAVSPALKRGSTAKGCA